MRLSRSIGSIVLVFVGAALTVAVLMTPITIRAAGPGACPSDSKLLNGGPTLVFGDGPGTWWGLTLDGLKDAFDTDAERLAYLEGIFGQDFEDLEDAKAYNLQGVAAWDENNNGYVCAYDLRGRRAYLNDPYLSFTTFGISDDRIAKK